MRIFQIAWGGISKNRLWTLIQEQAALIEQQRAYIDWLELTHTRNVRDLIHNFQMALDSDAMDEDALRDGLQAALVDLNDHVARLEEHSAS